MEKGGRNGVEEWNGMVKEWINGMEGRNGLERMEGRMDGSQPMGNKHQHDGNLMNTTMAFTKPIPLKCLDQQQGEQE